MDSHHIVWLEGLLIIGVVFGFGVWQLISLRREQRRDREAKRKQEQKNT